MKSEAIKILILIFVTSIAYSSSYAYPEKKHIRPNADHASAVHPPAFKEVNQTACHLFDTRLGQATTSSLQPYYSIALVQKSQHRIESDGPTKYLHYKSAEASPAVCHTYACSHHRFLHIHKTMPSQVQYNHPFEYTIQVLNHSDAIATHVVVEEHLSRPIHNLQSNPPARLNDLTLVWTLGDMPPGSERLLHVRGVALETGPIRTCARLSFGTPAWCQQIEVVKPSLALAAEMPSQTGLCETIPLKLTVTNTGTVLAQGIIIQSTLSRDIQTKDGQSRLSLEAGTLEPGQSKVLLAELRALQTGTYEIVATAVAADGTRSQTMPIRTTVGQPVLTIDVSAADMQYLERPVEYTLTVTNIGDRVAQNIVLEDMIPSGMHLVNASHLGVAQGDKVVWDLPSLPPQQSHVLELSLFPNRAGTFTNRSIVRADCVSPATTFVTTSVRGIGALVLEVVDIKDPIALGNYATYDITTINQGTSAVTNLRIVCTLEDNVEYHASSGTTTATVVGNTITFGPLSVPPKAKASWRVVVRAMRPGDVRFKVSMTANELTRAVEETESTVLYE